LTRLLVSVRDPAEALAAVQGGADIIDVKEPNHGSLGRASRDTMQKIAEALKHLPDVPLSLALGELTEWANGERRLADDLQPALSARNLNFLKLGLSGQADPSSPADAETAHWTKRWTGVRSLLPADTAWVAVAYADHNRAAAPDPESVCDAAIATGCKVLLLDTFIKDGSTLVDWVPLSRLKALRVKTQSAGLLLAFAGKVTEQLLPELMTLSPDIIAIRGAVCTGGDRKAAICPDRIRTFKQRLFCQ
jgi:uncharacterized protein (UPF0264 family)